MASELTNSVLSKSGDENRNSTLVIAYNEEPITLDSATTTRNPTIDLSKMIYEALFTIDADHNPRPLLAESYEVSENGLVYTIRLRHGVSFHDGTEMTADDVVACMKRWSSIAGIAKALPDPAWSKVDDYTVAMTLSRRSYTALDALATQEELAGIMPKRLIDSAGEGPVKEYIGTGPYRFVSWKQNDSITFERFDGYQNPKQTWNGLAGERAPRFERIVWKFVTSGASRAAGIRAGDYDVAVQIPLDQVPTLQKDSNIQVELFTTGLVELNFNKKSGPMSDLKARQAVNLAMIPDDLLMAAFTTQDFFERSPAFFPKDNARWYTDAGKEVLEKQDPVKAKQLMEETGFDGVIKILVNRDNQQQYDLAVVLTQQLNNAGLTTKMTAVDSATYSDQRRDPDRWDIFPIDARYGDIPSHFIEISNPEFPGWTTDTEIAGLFKQIDAATSSEEAHGLMVKLQQRVFDVLATEPIGAGKEAIALNAGLKGFFLSVSPIFLNTYYDQ